MSNPLDYRSPGGAKPRPRFSRRTKWIAIVVIGIAMTLAAIQFLGPSLNKDGGLWMKLEFTVRDAATNAPLPGAKVTVFNDDGVPATHTPPATTDSAGKCVSRQIVGWGCRKTLLYEVGGFGASERTLQVSMPGYETVVIAPGNYAYWRIAAWPMNTTKSLDVVLQPIATTQPAAN